MVADTERFSVWLRRATNCFVRTAWDSARESRLSWMLLRKV